MYLWVKKRNFTNSQMVFVSSSTLYLDHCLPDTRVFSFPCDYPESTLPTVSCLLPFCGLSNTTTFVCVCFLPVCVCAWVEGLLFNGSCASGNLRLLTSLPIIRLPFFSLSFFLLFTYSPATEKSPINSSICGRPCYCRHS